MSVGLSNGADLKLADSGTAAPAGAIAVGHAGCCGYLLAVLGPGHSGCGLCADAAVFGRRVVCRSRKRHDLSTVVAAAEVERKRSPALSQIGVAGSRA